MAADILSASNETQTFISKATLKLQLHLENDLYEWRTEVKTPTTPVAVEEVKVKASKTQSQMLAKDHLNVAKIRGNRAEMSNLMTKFMEHERQQSEINQLNAKYEISAL